MSPELFVFYICTLLTTLWFEKNTYFSFVWMHSLNASLFATVHWGSQQQLVSHTMPFKSHEQDAAKTNFYISTENSTWVLCSTPFQTYLFLCSLSTSHMIMIIQFWQHITFCNINSNKNRNKYVPLHVACLSAKIVRKNNVLNFPIFPHGPISSNNPFLLKLIISVLVD